MPHRIKNFICATAATTLAAIAASPAPADGVTAYLPLNLEPEMEQQIEKLLILADEPILKRPFAVALVELALPKACERDKALCTRVKKYLERYGRDYALTHASLTGAITHAARDPHGADEVMPNQHGLPVDADWEVSAQGFVQPNDYFLAAAGVIAYPGRTSPSGSMLSLGFNWGQIDLGYRDHWFSPATDGSMLISTETPTMPSVTVSNYEPLTRFGFQYELFSAVTSRTDHILYQGREGSGRPRLFGAQFSIEPFSGWSLGANRLLEYGGGNGLPDGLRFLLRDFFKPSGLSQTQANQQASYVSRFIFPGKTPFAVYFQYAGEDNSNGGSYLLGSAAFTAGISIPRLARHFDVTYEIAEWQNIWYVHNIFLDGMSNDGLVLGNWGADQRNFGDGVGARTQMLRVGWEPPFGGYLEERIRTVANQSYYGGDSRSYSAANIPFPYHHYYDLTVRYSRPWKDLTVGAEALAGRDIYGKPFSRLSGFVRYGGDGQSRYAGSSADADDSDVDDSGDAGAERFVDAGVNVNRVRTDAQQGIPIVSSKVGFDPHLGLGARRAVSAKNDWGVRVELDQVDGHSLLGVRAIDYRHRFNQDFAFGLFAGVARYNVATPAYSVYFGLGALRRNILPKWDLGVDLRHAQNVARDHVLAADPQGPRPDTFYKIDTALMYLSRRF